MTYKEALEIVERVVLCCKKIQFFVNKNCTFNHGKVKIVEEKSKLVLKKCF